MRRTVVAALLSLIALPALADEVGSVGYRFKWVGPNDKIVVDAFDDPDVPGVTCYIARARTGGVKGAMGWPRTRRKPRSPAARSERSTRAGSASCATATRSSANAPR